MLTPRSSDQLLGILIVDDHSMVCEGFRQLLSTMPEVMVLGVATDGHEAIKLADELKPHLILMDVAMPNLNGVEATRQIMAEHPEIKIIALSAYDDRKFVTEMLRLGVRAYLLKGGSFDELTTAIRAVAKGRRYIDQEITDQVLEDYSRRLDEDSNSLLDVLSPRERQVLQLLAEGLSTKGIAEQLFVSAKTIETHRRALMNKLNVFSLAELTKLAVREGLTTLEF